MDIGSSALKNMEAWAKECEWNFQNKLHLLRGQYFFAIKNFSKAEEEYQLSIEAASQHQFIHEKALALELAGLFHKKCGRKDLSDSLLRQSHHCYRSWGAIKKADSLLKSLDSGDD